MIRCSPLFAFICIPIGSVRAIFVLRMIMPSGSVFLIYNFAATLIFRLNDRQYFCAAVDAPRHRLWGTHTASSVALPILYCSRRGLIVSCGWDAHRGLAPAVVIGSITVMIAPALINRQSERAKYSLSR